MDREECTRVWISESGQGWKCHPRSCVFCDNCTDIWYDNNGPYMIFCDKGLLQETGFEGKCEYFTEEHPTFIDRDTYIKQRIETQKQVSKFYNEHKNEINKIMKEYLDNIISGFADVKDIPFGDKVNLKGY